MTVYEIIQEFIKKNNYIQDEHVLRKNKDLNYIWKYDNNKSLKEQKIHKDTIHILSYINTEFILEGEQRKIIKKFHILNEMKNETLKKQKYNPENIFKKNIK